MIRTTVIQPLVEGGSFPYGIEVKSNSIGEEGTTAPEMMLLPNIRDPATGSLIPSISTGGAAINATMKQVVAASKHGIIRTPNHPTYILLSVDVTHSVN